LEGLGFKKKPFKWKQLKQSVALNTVPVERLSNKLPGTNLIMQLHLSIPSLNCLIIYTDTPVL
jgi:hypothetical protein